MSMTDAERQAARRRRLKQGGLQRISVYVDQETASTLRQIASQHHRTQADVLQLSMRVAARLLDGSVVLTPKPSENDSWSIEP